MLKRSPLYLSLFTSALALPAAAQGIQFNEVTTGSGIDVPLSNTAPGLSVGDVNGDGWKDVLMSGALDDRVRLFLNRAGHVAAGAGGPLFIEVTNLVFTQGSNGASHAMFADIDGDRDLDIVAARRFPDPLLGGYGLQDTGIEFYRNDSNGREFVKLPTPESLGRNDTPFGGLTLGDPDRDGDIDIVYVHNGGGNGVGGPGHYLRNDGGGSFSDQTSWFGGGLGIPTRYFSTILFDFNGDDLLDMHSAVDFFVDQHYRGMGDGSFQNVTQQVGTTNQGSDMGLAIGDPDNDGDFDLYSTNINVGVFYENDGAGNFTNTAAAHGIQKFNHGLSTCMGWGTAFADFDLDGDEDLVAIGTLGLGELFENDGTGHFSKVSSGAGITLIGRSLVTFDFDRDGDLDVMIGHEGQNHTPRLYENVTASAQGRHWLEVHPLGRSSVNGRAVGAHVEIISGGSSQHRAIAAGQSFKSGFSYSAHFGLGGSDLVEEVRVHWPGGGTTVLTDVQPDRPIRVQEPLP